MVTMELSEEEVAKLEAFRDQILELARVDETGRLEELYNRMRLFIEENRKP